MDPLVWWKNHGTDLPYWSAAAKNVILVQPSSSAAERAFTNQKTSFGPQQEKITSGLHVYRVWCNVAVQYTLLLHPVLLYCCFSVCRVVCCYPFCPLYRYVVLFVKNISFSRNCGNLATHNLDGLL